MPSALTLLQRLPGPAGLSRTQRLVSRSVKRPAWVWRMVARRPCWRNVRLVEIHMPSVTITPNADGTFTFVSSGAEMRDP